MGFNDRIKLEFTNRFIFVEISALAYLQSNRMSIFMSARISEMAGPIIPQFLGRFCIDPENVSGYLF